MDKAFDKLDQPLDVNPIKKRKNQIPGTALIVKEMPYQVGDNFPILISLTDQPIIFLIRDPRLNISSRMNKKREAGQDPIFPLIETGWELLAEQLKYIEDRGIHHMIVDATDFRNFPQLIFPEVFKQLHLSFSADLLEWQPAKDVDIDNLKGTHRHLYRRALLSTGIQPVTEAVPSFEWFPVEGGFRDHVLQAMEIYKKIKASAARIHPNAKT